MLKYKFFLLLGVIIAFIVWILKRKIDKYKIKKWSKKVATSCSAVPSAETIFVSIVCNENYTLVGHLLYELMKNAYCPSRIHIGLLCIKPQENSNDKNDFVENLSNKIFGKSHAIEMYKQLTCDWDTNWIDHIRVFTRDDSEVKGLCHARSIIETDLHNGEKYYCTLNYSSEPVMHWDEKLISEFETCVKKKKSNRVVLTGPLKQQSKNSKLSDSGVENTPPWPVLEKWCNKTGYPVFSQKNFKNTPQEFYKSVIWCSDFSFCLAKETMKTARHPKNMYYLEKSAYEIMMTLLHVCNDHPLYTPTKVFFCASDSSSIQVNTKNIDFENEKQDSYRSLHEWMNMVDFVYKEKVSEKFYPFDFDFKNAKCSEKTKWGIPENSTSNEVVAKIGSYRFFHYTS